MINSPFIGHSRISLLLFLILFLSGRQSIGCRQDIFLHYIQGLVHQNVVLQAGEYRNHLLIWKDKNELPCSASGTIGLDHSVNHFE